MAAETICHGKVSEEKLSNKNRSPGTIIIIIIIIFVKRGKICSVGIDVVDSKRKKIPKLYFNSTPIIIIKIYEKIINHE